MAQIGKVHAGHKAHVASADDRDVHRAAGYKSHRVPTDRPLTGPEQDRPTPVGRSATRRRQGLGASRWRWRWRWQASPARILVAEGGPEGPPCPFAALGCAAQPEWRSARSHNRTIARAEPEGPYHFREVLPHRSRAKRPKWIVTRGARTTDMRHDRRWHVPNRHPARRGAPAEVCILEEHEILLIEAAELPERLPPDRETGAGYEVRVECFVGHLDTRILSKESRSANQGACQRQLDEPPSNDVEAQVLGRRCRWGPAEGRRSARRRRWDR